MVKQYFTNNIIDKILPFQPYWEKHSPYITSSKITLWSILTNDTTHDVRFLNKICKNISGIRWSMFRVCHDPKQHTQKSVILMGVKSWGPKPKFYRLSKLKAQKKIMPCCEVYSGSNHWLHPHHGIREKNKDNDKEKKKQGKKYSTCIYNFIFLFLHGSAFVFPFSNILCFVLTCVQKITLQT